MALSIKVGDIAAPASTGNQSTTGIGFQPKALLFFSGRGTATGEIGGVHQMFGFAGTAAQDISFYHNSADAVAASDAVRSLLTTAILKTTVLGATTAAVTATLTSMDSDGWTINYSAVVNGEKFPYLAIGGDDVTNAVAGTFALNTGTGNQSITGLGFQPDIIFFFTQLLTSAGTANSTTSIGYGVAQSSSAQWSVCHSNQHAQATTNTRRVFTSSKCIMILKVVSDTVESDAALVSMDSDGFTINKTTGSTAYLVGYLAIKGGQWKVGNFQQPNGTTGNQSVTGVGFQPSGVFFGSAQTTTDGTVTPDSYATYGAATSSSAMESFWNGDLDNSADTVAKRYYKTDKVIQFRTAVSTGSTLLAEASYVSNDTDGFTVNWSTADANQRYVGYVAFGSSSTTAIKTFNNLAKASVKTINGLAIASIKTVNGLA